MWKCLFSTSYKYCFHFYFDSVQTITFQTTGQRQGTTGWNTGKNSNPLHLAGAQKYRAAQKEIIIRRQFGHIKWTFGYILIENQQKIWLYLNENASMLFCGPISLVEIMTKWRFERAYCRVVIFAILGWCSEVNNFQRGKFIYL